MKNKKPLIIAGVAVLLLGIGFTVAYNMDLIPFLNNFGLAKYQTEYVDTFTSPSDWKPCDTTSKTIAITNKGNVDVSARVKLSDYWKDKDGNDLADLMSGDQKLTVINFHDGWENKWDYVDGWYVYKTNLTPNETTEPLIDSVTLSCDANLAGEVNYTDNGQTGESGTSPYLGASFHIEATLQTIQADAKNEWVALYNATVNRVNSLGDYQIDFSKKAVKSDNVATANGNGVNTTTEKGKTVYYYRGEVDNNYVVWANYCWRIVRTTYTGGTKMIYSGEPTTVDGKQQCLATGDDLGIALEENGETKKKFAFNDDDYSFADFGYMYGEKLQYDSLDMQYAQKYQRYTFSDEVYIQDGQYYLSTIPGHYTSGRWVAAYSDVWSSHFYYFCLDGAAACSGDKLAYVLNDKEDAAFIRDRATGGGPFICADYDIPGGCYVHYTQLGDHISFEEAHAAIYENNNDSIAKRAIDSWFVQHLINYDGDLEDAVYCNDRSMVRQTRGLVYSAGTRISSHSPTLECANKNDAFTKDDSVNGNAALDYAIGLPSVDEVMMAGLYGANDYIISTDTSMWTATPASATSLIRILGARSYGFDSDVYYNYPDKLSSLRPVVSLKSGTEIKAGDGQKTNPYIVE